MAGDAGDIDDRTASLLTHDRNDGLHGRQSAEEIRFEKVVAGVHVHLGDGVEQAVARHC